MNRRDSLSSLAALGAASLIAPSAIRAQPSNHPRIASLSVSQVPSVVVAFQDALTRLGYVDGKNIAIEYRDADGNPDRVPALVAELLKEKPDVMVVWSTVAAVAARRATSTVPTVFLSVGAPVEIGLVQSLKRPGGNLTGVTFEAAWETYAKRLQILKEVVPKLRVVAVLQASGDPNVGFAMSSLDRVAPSLGIRLESLQVGSPDALESAIRTASKNGAEALLVVAGAFTFANGVRIAELARAYRLPSIHAFKETVESGGLMSLGPDFHEMARRGAALVDLILKGSKPADIPVEQPTRYEFHVNLKTARMLGIEIPKAVLLRADGVIE